MKEGNKIEWLESSSKFGGAGQTFFFWIICLPLFEMSEYSSQGFILENQWLYYIYSRSETQIWICINLFYSLP